MEFERIKVPFLNATTYYCMTIGGKLITLGWQDFLLSTVPDPTHYIYALRTPVQTCELIISQL